MQCGCLDAWRQRVGRGLIGSISSVLRGISHAAAHLSGLSRAFHRAVAMRSCVAQAHAGALSGPGPGPGPVPGHVTLTYQRQLAIVMYYLLTKSKS